MKKLLIAIGILLTFSCSNNENEPLSIDKSNIENQNNDTIVTTEKPVKENQSTVQIFINEKGADSFAPKMREGFIFKWNNDKLTGCYFIYDPEQNAILNDVMNIKTFNLYEDGSFEFNYKAIAIGDASGIVNVSGELYEGESIYFKTKCEDCFEYSGGETFQLVESLPSEAYNYLPELKKYTSTEKTSTSSTKKDIPKYSDIRATLINETDPNAIEDLLGEADEEYSHTKTTWHIYYFAAEKNGQIGHLKITQRGLWNGVIDEVKYYSPGSRIRIGAQYLNSPTTR